MWPWGHAAVGYLLYRAGVRSSRGWRLAGPSVVVLALGTQFPDLVDKPLAWTIGLLPSGRSLAHSLLVIGLLLAILMRVATSVDRRHLAVAFSVGTLSHLLADGLYPIIEGELYYLSFLGWPLVPPIEYGMEQSFQAHLQPISLTPTFVFEIVLTATALAIWYNDGFPGLPSLPKLGR